MKRKRKNYTFITKKENSNKFYNSWNSFLFENITRNDFNLTIEDLQELESNHFLFQDEKKNINFLVDYYFEKEQDRDAIENLLKLLSSAGQRTISYLDQVPYIDTLALAKTLLSYQNLFELNTVEDIFPIPVYISSGPADKNTIGILVHNNGKKIEPFEGNDEATEETVALVNKLLYPEENLILVYGSHEQSTVNTIKETGKIPKNLYVSPDKSYASGFWGENRILFSGKVDPRDFSQESNVDWKAIKTTPIKNLKIY